MQANSVILQPNYSTTAACTNTRAPNLQNHANTVILQEPQIPPPQPQPQQSHLAQVPNVSNVALMQQHTRAPQQDRTSGVSDIALFVFSYVFFLISILF